MTGDLARITSFENPVTVSSKGFILAVRKKLETL
jgi:hypothetical protein